MNSSPIAPEQLRVLVDTVDTPSFASIVERAGSKEPGRRQRPVLMAAAIAAAVALVVAAVVVLPRDGDGARTVRVPPADAPAALPDDCLITAQGQVGCEMSPADAGAHLGFDVRVPTGVPDGWVHVYENLKVYRPGLSPEPVPPGADVVLYNQVWAPPGTDLNAPGTCPTYLQVRERRAFDGEASSQAVLGAAIDLGDGHVAFGEESSAACGSGEGPVHAVSLLSWESDGIWFSVLANGIPPERVRAVARSIAG